MRWGFEERARSPSSVLTVRGHPWDPDDAEPLEPAEPLPPERPHAARPRDTTPVRVAARSRRRPMMRRGNVFIAVLPVDGLTTRGDLRSPSQSCFKCA